MNRFMVSRKAIFAGAYLAIALVSIALRELIHPYAEYVNIHDDGLMVHLAHQILSTGWVSDWTDVTTRTLAKGPGFPLYLAANRAWVPWTFLVTNQILLLIGAFLVIREFRFFGLKASWGVVAFAFIAFFPVWYSLEATRVYRDAFLAVLVMLMLAGALMTRRNLIGFVRAERKLLSAINLFISTGLLGLVFGWYYITKVNWQVFAFVIVCTLFTALVEVHREKLARLLLTTAACLAIFSLLAGGVILGVSQRNAKELGVFAVEDFGSGPFASSVNTLMRIPDPRRPEYVDVSLDMMRDAAEVSPLFAELMPNLEHTFWSEFECKNYKLCNGELGLWFPWALRDAAEKSGHANTALEFENFFRDMNAELIRACEIGSLKCGSPGLAPGLRALSTLSPRLIVDAYGYGLNHLVSLSSAQPISEEKTQLLTPELWNETVRGLLTVEQRNRPYNPGSFFLQGVTVFLVNLYKPIWALSILVGLAGLVARKAWSDRGWAARRRALALSSIGAILLLGVLGFIGQIALLEADGGSIMIASGYVYLLPVYPMVLVGILAGITRLQQVLTKEAVVEASPPLLP
jgi:hypothetical protein